MSYFKELETSKEKKAAHDVAQKAAARRRLDDVTDAKRRRKADEGRGK